MKKIVVVGSYIVALVMDTDRLPVAGETLMGKNFRQTYGGKGSNQAVQAARLGADVSFVGKIGNDAFGSDFLALCKNEHINAEFVFRHQQLPTASGLIICAQGKNIITIDIGALNDFNVNDIDQSSELFTPESIVLLQLEIPVDTALYAAKKAKEKGATVILNPAPAINLSKMDLSNIDYLTPNENEARICIGLKPNACVENEDIARKILELNCKNVIITLGEKGCLFVNRYRKIVSPAFEFKTIVDSTGAGDAFNAGLAVALIQNKPIEEAMRYANATGGLACTRPDTIPSLHTSVEVELFLRENHKCKTK